MVNLPEVFDTVPVSCTGCKDETVGMMACFLLIVAWWPELRGVSARRTMDWEWTGSNQYGLQETPGGLVNGFEIKPVNQKLSDWLTEQRTYQSGERVHVQAKNL